MTTTEQRKAPFKLGDVVLVVPEYSKPSIKKYISTPAVVTHSYYEEGEWYIQINENIHDAYYAYRFKLAIKNTPKEAV